MKVIIKIFLLCGLVFVVLNAQNQINAMRVPGNVSKIGPQSKAWLSAGYTDITLYPRTIINEINPQANISSTNLKVKKARVKALYDGENFSLLLAWNDTTQNISEGCCSKTHKDGFVLQFPVVYSDVSKLPYISMGSKNRPVILHLKYANEHSKNDHYKSMQEYFETYYKPIDAGDSGHIFEAQGYTNMSEIKEDNISAVMDMVYKNDIWKGTLSRPLKTEYLDLSGGAFPVSIVIWDGNASNLERIEYSSSWIGVKLLGMSDGDELLSALQEEVSGNLLNGEKLAIENCAVCHNFANSMTAPINMAPNLSNIGGYSTTQYLIESLIDPSVVLTPGYNPNEQPNFPWYHLNEIGNIVSTMPSYDWMDETSINDLVVFLQSLKEEER